MKWRNIKKIIENEPALIDRAYSMSLAGAAKELSAFGTQGISTFEETAEKAKRRSEIDARKWKPVERAIICRKMTHTPFSRLVAVAAALLLALSTAYFTDDFIAGRHDEETLIRLTLEAGRNESETYLKHETYLAGAVISSGLKRWQRTTVFYEWKYRDEEPYIIGICSVSIRGEESVLFPFSLDEILWEADGTGAVVTITGQRKILFFRVPFEWNVTIDATAAEAYLQPDDETIPVDRR